MTKRIPACLVVLCLAGLACAPAGDKSKERVVQEAEPVPPQVTVQTNLGRIVIELDPAKAPLSVRNFQRLVRSRFYDGLTFHRIRPGFMIQGGKLTADMKRRSVNIVPVDNEADNGLHNVRGTVAMARTLAPHSATTEFFINLVDNPKLDFKEKTAKGWGYTVFGRVIEGMDVVDSIAKVPTKRYGPYEALPVTPVVMESVYVSSGN